MYTKAEIGVPVAAAAMAWVLAVCVSESDGVIAFRLVA